MALYEYMSSIALTIQFVKNCRFEPPEIPYDKFIRRWKFGIGINCKGSKGAQNFTTKIPYRY